MSIIAAGTTTTTALSSTGNTDGTLQLQVNGTTPSVTLNTLGAIGVGSSPSYGTSGQVLISGGSTTAPTWGTAGSATTATNLAGGSNGTIPYQSASGTTQMLAVGTSGQVLQSNGASAPSWVTPGGGSWVYLSTVTASAAATADLDYAFDSTYDMYAIVAENISVSIDVSNVLCRMKVSGAYITNSTYRATWIQQNSEGTPSGFNGSGGTATSIQMTSSVSNLAGATMGFVAYLPIPYSTSKYKSINISGVYTNSTPAVGLMGVGGQNTTTSALQGVRFYTNTGTITGTFRLYGIKNS